MAKKKYLSLERLAEYDALLKTKIADDDAAILAQAATNASNKDAVVLSEAQKGIDAVQLAVDTLSDNLQDAIDGKANASHTHDDRYYTESEVDTKISGVNSTISSHTGNTTVHITSGERTNWNSAYSHSTSAHAPSNAERNIIVGIQKNGTDLTVDSSTRKVNITVPTTAAEIGAATSGHNHDSAYDSKGSAADALAEAKTYADTKTSGMATTTVVDSKISSHNTSTTAHSDIRDLISALSTKVNNFLDVDDTTTDELSEILELINNNKGTLESLTSSKVNVSDIVNNLTTASETKVLSANQGVVLKGLIDSLQAAVDGKAASSHSHTITATATDDDVIVLTGTNGTNKVTFDAKHATSGVTAGTYKSVTVNAYGHVTGGSNPTTLSGYGITDAYTKTQVDSIASGKAAATHTHAIADVSGLQSALDDKATIEALNSAIDDANTEASNKDAVVLSEAQKSSSAVQTNLDTHIADTTKHITSTERTNWGAAYTHSQSTHAPSNAQANVIESIKVNGTAQTISSKSVNITVPTKASDIGAAASSHTHAISDITNLQTTLNNASSAISSNTSSITALTSRTESLENKVGDGFEEITSAEISALFA